MNEELSSTGRSLIPAVPWKATTNVLLELMDCCGLGAKTPQCQTSRIPGWLQMQAGHIQYRSRAGMRGTHPAEISPAPRSLINRRRREYISLNKQGLPPPHPGSYQVLARQHVVRAFGGLRWLLLLNYRIFGWLLLLFLNLSEAEGPV